MASSSHPTLVRPTIPPPFAPSPPPSISSPLPSIPFPPYVPLPSLEEFPTQLEEPQSQTHLCSDCASCSRFCDSMSILQDLVFAVRKDVDNLRFRPKHLDKRAKQIESMLATLLSSLHSPKLSTGAPTTSGVFLAPAIQVAAEGDVDKHER